jgi:hypothetical protein
MECLLGQLENYEWSYSGSTEWSPTSKTDKVGCFDHGRSKSRKGVVSLIRKGETKKITKSINGEELEVFTLPHLFRSDSGRTPTKMTKHFVPGGLYLVDEQKRSFLHRTFIGILGLLVWSESDRNPRTPIGMADKWKEPGVKGIWSDFVWLES